MDKKHYVNYDSDEEFLKVSSSLVEVDNFISSQLHEDFQRDINRRLGYLTSMLDDFDAKYNGKEYDMFRGGKRVLMEMRNLFIDIKDALIDKMEEQNEQNKE